MKTDQVAAGVVLFLFSVTWIAAGWWFGRSGKNADDFMLAGRKVGTALGAATAMATWITSNTVMLAPQLAYQLGIWGIIGYSGGALGLILFAPLSARIRYLMPGGTTAGDFFRLRYGKNAWRIFLIISLVYAFGWMISLAMAGGIILETLTGMDYFTGMTLILAVCVSYTVLGGMKAVIGTDYIQTLIILAGLSFTAYYIQDTLSLREIYDSVEAERPFLLTLAFPAALMFLFNNILFGTGEIFHSNVWWSRAFAFREGTGFRAYLLAGILWIPVPVAAGFTALAAPGLGINIPSADMTGPLTVSAVLGKTGNLIFFIVIFSALASSMDSLLAATGDIITEDIYRKHLRPEASPKELFTAARISPLVLGTVTWYAASLRISDLGNVLFFTGALVSSTIWPVITGLYFRRGSGAGAFWSMLLGSAAGLTAFFMIGFYAASVFGAAVSMVITLLYMAAGKEYRFRWEDLKE